MKHILLLVSSVLVFATQGAVALEPTGSLIRSVRLRPRPAFTSHITVTVPHDEAELIIEGRTIPGAGTSRELETPLLLNAGTMYRYQFTATWKPSPYTDDHAEENRRFSGRRARGSRSHGRGSEGPRASCVCPDAAGYCRRDGQTGRYQRWGRRGTNPVAATHGLRLPRSTAEQAGVSALTSTRRRWPTLSRESKRQVSRTRSKSDWVMRWTFKICRQQPWSSCTWATTSTC